jgi:hypothetical protein
MIEAHLEKLAAAGINLIPADLEKHFIFERDGFIALVERTAAGFGSVGTAGLLTDRGLAPLVWRGTDAWFVARGLEQRAMPEQVDSLRSFQSDLEAALR